MELVNQGLGMSVTTKTGDSGKSLFAGKRVSKDSVEMEALGVLDELSAILQIVNLKDIVEDLRGIMGILGNGTRYKKLELRTKILEKEIEEIEKKLPRQERFLSFEKEGATYLNWARTVCRRAERFLVKYSKKHQNLDPNILIYINRLSDYLFIKAREYNEEDDSDVRLKP